MINRPCAPLNVLIVEDEALLAMDIEAMVEDAGHKVVAEAASLFDVEDLDSTLVPDLAFVDVQLAQGTNGIDVCHLIRERWSDAFVVFVTANPLKIPEDYAGGHGVIPKPFSRNGLLSAMRYIEEGVCDPPPTSPQPASFIAAPAFAASWK
ncbi:response regulator [Sphingomonas jatrophae]|uniref:CheY chemotaxis protein or a CheY-like REC (Receiver) domain n=1 Tax=Sphingomonas jatrophae TaxID=1166337 RepID=A0A1I6MA07_9SPHN|nr:response regulator [Sphingomonas jatrophae]SFS12448.1 CheY chemotaxis protein or a CheY-like REC (receiver) domain [Sphingomonas jatrophae]